MRRIALLVFTAVAVLVGAAGCNPNPVCYPLGGGGGIVCIAPN